MSAAGTVALVTGGSRGIGAALVERLASRGYRVAFTYREQKARAEELASRLVAAGGCAEPVGCEGTDARSVSAAVAQVTERLGPVSVLVNNIGKVHDGVAAAMRDEFRDVVVTNLRSTFLFTRAVIGPMMRRRFGRIVNVSSMVGRNPGAAGQCNYVAAKAAIHSFTKSVALEVAGRGITVNAVAPGLVHTDLSRAVLQRRAAIVNVIPMRRLAEREEVADLVEFLVSERAAYVTGEIIGVTGGMCL